jgi:hypothetical protein
MKLSSKNRHIFKSIVSNNVLMGDYMRLSQFAAIVVFAFVLFSGFAAATLAAAVADEGTASPSPASHDSGARGVIDPPAKPYAPPSDRKVVAPEPNPDPRTPIRDNHTIVAPEPDPDPDTTPPSISTSVLVKGSTYTISAIASDESGISAVAIYMAKSSVVGQAGSYQRVASCSSSPCVYTSGDSPGLYYYYAYAADNSSRKNAAFSEPKTFVISYGASPLQITTGSLPEAKANLSYSAQISASGGVPPYLFSASGLPEGLSISSTTGRISGVPLKAGVFSISASVRDAAGTSQSKQLSLKVEAPASNGTGTTPSGASTGGGAGGGSAGGSTAVLVSSQTKACVGQPMEIGVKKTAKSGTPTVEIVYKSGSKNERVLYQKAEQGSTIFFTPQNAGAYEIRVSLGADQRTADFKAELCGPSAQAQNVPLPRIELKEEQKLVFSKTVEYAGGFKKEFKTYEIGSSGEYYTEIVLSYTNPGEAIYSAAISDSIPREVLSSPEKISFQIEPSKMLLQPQITFTWVTSIPAKGKVSYTYRINRAITSEMLSKFEAPSIEVRQAKKEQSEQQNLLAASIELAGFSIPVIWLAFAVLGLVLVGAVALLVFGSKKEQS